jgi:hypothetical protein
MLSAISCADFEYGAPGEGYSRVSGAFLVPEVQQSSAAAAGAEDGKRHAEWESFESQVRALNALSPLCLSSHVL